MARNLLLGKLLFFRGKLVDRRRVIALSGLQLRRRKLRMVRGVGKMLGLQTERHALGIRNSTLALGGSIQKIPSVKLHSRLGRPHFQNSTGSLLCNARGEGDAVTHFAPQDKVVIVAFAEFDLLVVGIDSLANRRWIPKIKRRAGHTAKLSSGNQSRVHRSKLVRLDN